MARRFVVFPVPVGMSPEDAWAEIEVFGMLAEGRIVTEDGEGGCWAVMEFEVDQP